ncbi:hypothetical protein ABK967_23160, partial [Vibrio parahaemolyticus]
DLEQRIENIRRQAQQAVSEANQEAAELRKQLSLAEKRKKNAAATAERRKRKLRKTLQSD